MKNKRVVVCVKFFKGELNPFDAAALECALTSGAKEITVLSMAPVSAMNAMQGLTRLGVNAVLISDPVYAGSDTIATSLVLKEAILRLAPDFVYCGRQSVDGDTAQVPAMLAKRLGVPVVDRIVQTDGERVLTRSGEEVIPTGGVLSFERIKTLRFPSLFSRPKEVEVWDNSVLQLPVERCGKSGSPTRVIKSYESAVGRRTCAFLNQENFWETVLCSLQKERKDTCSVSGERLDEVYYAGEVQAVANAISHRAIPLETDGKTAEEVAAFIKERKIKTVLWEDDCKRKILASEVAVLLNAGLCADCISFRVERGVFVMTRPALGGNITADIVADSETAMATVRTPKKGKSDLVFAVGKGAVDYLDEITALAERYGAELCSSRIVVDGGKMPYETQVGLTGKPVSPKTYVAFGISGAVQHTCAVEGAGTVFAVNIDKDARIFDYADYGLVGDVSEIIK